MPWLFLQKKIVGERNFITCCCFDGRFVPMGFREWHVVYASSRRNHKYYRRGWVIYRITRNKEHETDNRNAPLVQEFYKKLLPNIKRHIKWVCVPLGILLVLWLSKSILIAFIVGFGITAFLDRQLIQTKGLNRVAIILLLYTVGFLLLLVGIFKIDNEYNYGDFKFLLGIRTYYYGT